MKYAIRNKRGNYLRTNGAGFQLSAFIPFGGWALFDSVPDALGALQERAVRYGPPVPGPTLVRVEEIPGETKREVVELSGVVDFTGLKFALTGINAADGGEFYISSRQMEWTSDLSHASIFDSISDVWQDVKDNERVHIQPYAHRVVGIREVTTAPTFKITELA